MDLFCEPLSETKFPFYPLLARSKPVNISHVCPILSSKVSLAHFRRKQEKGVEENFDVSRITLFWRHTN